MKHNHSRKEGSSMFKVHDLWGITAGMLTLIALYLLVKNSAGSTNILGAMFNGSGNLVKDLQGRG
jgi:hypothetical protein